MDSASAVNTSRKRHALLLIALAPVVPQLIGTVFNIWYNAAVIEPMLTVAGQRRFLLTVIIYNGLIYPVAVWFWLAHLSFLRSPFQRLSGNLPIDPTTLTRARRRLIHLPWFAATVAGIAWFLCIPVFLLALGQVQYPLDPRLTWHLAISFCISGFIAVTHTVFLVELASHWGLFPIFFRDARADLMPNVLPLSLRARGLMWAISASICPIGSLLLLAFAPKAPATHPEWFAFFVGAIGIAFGLCTALMISWLVAKPVDELRVAAQAAARGEFDLHIATARADEFGLLIGEFNRMLRDLKDKEKLRQTFGLHVGRRAAEQILARDPGLSGAEQEITVMFVDIRSSTARTAVAGPAETVEILNDFFRVTVRVVEEEHGGMVNKYLGDGFMAVFGADDLASNHAQNAFDAGRQILLAVEELNLNLTSRGRLPLVIGIGIHSGPAIVGSIGSPQRLEFTAIGDTVNVASRIESLTKVVGKPLLITRAVRDRLQDARGVEELPPQSVRGVAEPISIYAPKDEA